MPQAIHRRCLLDGLVMTMSELKACPFCGSVPTRVDIASCGTFAVYCAGCRTTGPRIKVHPMEDRNEIDMARSAWNTRALAEESPDA